MIVERGKPLTHQTFLAETDSASRVGRLIIDGFRSGLGSFRLPRDVYHLQSDIARRNRLRPIIEAVHAGWDLTVEAGQATLPSDAEMESVRAWLSLDEYTDPYQFAHPVLAAISHRAMALQTVADDLNDRLSSVSSVSMARGDTVLYLTHSQFPETRSGYTRRTDNMVAALVEAGLNVRTLSTQSFIEAAPRLTRPGEALVDQIIEAADRLADHIGPDISHVLAASDWRTGWLGRWVSRTRNLPFAYEMRGFWELSHAAIHPEYARTIAFKARFNLEQALARSSDHVFYQSVPMAARLQAHASKDIVPNGSSLQTVVERKPSAELRLGYVGSLIDYEGLDVALSALSQVARKGYSISLDIIGDGPVAPALRALIGKLGLSETVRLQGSMAAADARSAIADFDATILPRRDFDVCHTVEPLKTLESLSMARPVLTSPLRVLEDMPGIWMAGGFDVLAWERLFIEASENRSRLITLGEQGRLFAETERRWPDVVKPIVQWVRTSQ